MDKINSILHKQRKYLKYEHNIRNYLIQREEISKINRIIKLGNKFKQPNIYVSPKGEQKGRKENIFKDTVPEKFPNLMETISPYQEVQLNPHHKNMNETTPQHVLIKLLKAVTKRKIFKQQEKKQSPQNIYIQGIKIRMKSEFSLEAVKQHF